MSKLLWACLQNLQAKSDKCRKLRGKWPIRTADVANQAGCAKSAFFTVTALLREEAAWRARASL